MAYTRSQKRSLLLNVTFTDDCVGDLRNFGLETSHKQDGFLFVLDPRDFEFRCRHDLSCGRKERIGRTHRMEFVRHRCVLPQLISLPNDLLQMEVVCEC